ncbi:MAG TPA: hypothetical protein VF798_15425 [Burkholderiaceae bacterium]
MPPSLTASLNRLARSPQFKAILLSGVMAVSEFSLTLVIAPIVVAKLGKVQAGVWLTMIGLWSVPQLISLGLPSILVRRLVFASGSSRDRQFMSYLEARDAYNGYLAFTTIVLAGISLGYVYPRIVASTETHLSVLLLIMAGFPIRLLSMRNGIVCNAYGRPDWDRAITTGFSVVHILFLVLAVQGTMPFGLAGIAAAWFCACLAAFVVSALLAGHLLRRVRSAVTAPRQGWAKQTWANYVSVMRESKPFASITISGFIITGLDAQLIALLAGIGAVPSYLISQRVASIPVLLASILSAAFFSATSKDWVDGNAGAIVSRARFLSTLCVGAGFAVMIAVALVRAARPGLLPGMQFDGLTYLGCQLFFMMSGIQSVYASLALATGSPKLTGIAAMHVLSWALLALPFLIFGGATVFGFGLTLATLPICYVVIKTCTSFIRREAAA